MNILALSGLGLLLVAGPAKAQQGWPIVGSNWGYYGGSSQGSSSWSSSGSSVPLYSSPSYSAPSYYAAYPPSFGNYFPSYYAAYPPSFSSSPYSYGSTSTEDYYSTANAESPKKRSVRVNLRVPGDAKIWFDKSQTKQTGTTRSFQSPPLDVGKEYAYHIRIQWRQDGKDVTETRRIAVHAGDVINLTLGSASGAALAQ
jgi:uncharacterized protein (TIGR03000 family)